MKHPAKSKKPLIWGVLNVDPLSFSEKGKSHSLDEALFLAEKLFREGADVLDVGGQSSHPKAKLVSPEEELERVFPLLKALSTRFPLSIDTQRPLVAKEALALGACVLNDVKGEADPEMVALALKHKVPLVLMANNFNTPLKPEEDIIAHLLGFWKRGIEEAKKRGLKDIVLDPGYGFGKTLEQNLEILRRLEELKAFPYPLLLGVSRKGSLGEICQEPNPQKRLGAGLAAQLWSMEKGVDILRTHDVAPLYQAREVWGRLAQVF